MPSTVCVGCLKIVDVVVPESRRCRENGCHSRWVAGRNARPEAQARRGISSGRRRRIYARDGFKCVRCGSTVDLTVGHEPPLASELDPRREYSDDELVTECRSCNSSSGGSVRRTEPHAAAAPSEPLIA